MERVISLKKYVVEIITENGRVKSFHTNDYEQALRVQEKYKCFAQKHKLTWVISLWGKGFLMESDTINPTKMLKIN